MKIIKQNRVTKVQNNFTGSIKSFKFNKTIMAKHPYTELDTSKVFTSIIQLLDELKTENDCRNHLEKLRWNDEPICPHCGSQNEYHYRLKDRGIFKGLYKCKDCRCRFTVTVGTMFEKTRVPLRKWFTACLLYTSPIPRD